MMAEETPEDRRRRLNRERQQAFRRRRTDLTFSKVAEELEEQRRRSLESYNRRQSRETSEDADALRNKNPEAENRRNLVRETSEENEVRRRKNLNSHNRRRKSLQSNNEGRTQELGENNDAVLIPLLNPQQTDMVNAYQDIGNVSELKINTSLHNGMLLLKRKHEQITPLNVDPAAADKSKAFARSDNSLVPPIRQTASIFKQSVTVVKMMKGSVKTDLVFGSQEKPKQLFWEKRLQGLTPCDKREQVIQSFELPKKIKAVGIELSDDTLIRSIATALHLNGHPIIGQNRPKALLDKNPGVHINPNQPLVLGLHVTEEDIAEQEKKVEEAREQLKAVMNEHHN